MNDLKLGIAIGIDGGGTKTLGILVNAEGREISRAQSGGANPWDVGAEAAQASLQGVLEPLMVGGNVRAVCFGSAGIDRESDLIATEKNLRALVPSNIAINVRNDAAAALGIVGPKRPAIVVIAGTGSIAYGEGADGKVVRVGGHGAIIGDAGSASALGLAAVRHTANAFDGSEPRGHLAEAIIKALKLRQVSDIVVRIQHPTFDVPLVASLAPLVEQAFQAGDRAAKTIVELEANALAANAKRVAHVVRGEPALPALLVGGVFSGFSEIRDRVKAALRQTGAVAIHESSECVHGAARIALDLAAK
ncbi:MAG TPA: BadF/BadG/BcrA/BcrD ATPase family protein [Candidatus Eremiobacteraceae bacterium]|nr:BadF/BadG/BcrA/BcrD ATPase family protein [Candidatus Eremiobacteraceae bacterium]